jgi:hypothetical protein
VRRASRLPALLRAPVAAIKAGVDCLPAGVKMVLNSGARRARDVPGAG